MAGTGAAVLGGPWGGVSVDPRPPPPPGHTPSLLIICPLLLLANVAVDAPLDIPVVLLPEIYFSTQ